MENLTVGTKVRLLARRYKGKEGIVVRVNHEEFDPERKQSPKLKWRDESVEYGVTFNLTPVHIENERTDAWFLPHEVEPLSG